MKFWKIINKAIDAFLAVVFVLCIFGLVFSSDVRNNLTNLVENLLNNEIIGIIVLLYILWAFKGIPRTIRKLFKAKGLNSKFWNDL
tara:strand:- start:298 stop:555 length:258 start_codon:yes stop_codon:yes gene_type:complete